MITQGHITSRRSDHVAELLSAWGRSVVGEVSKFSMSDADVCHIFTSFVAITGDATQITVFEDDIVGAHFCFDAKRTKWIDKW